MEPCPSCNVNIHIDAKPCPHCGNPEPFSDKLKEWIMKVNIENQKRADEIWQKKISKKEEEKKMFNEQMKEEILKGKFWLAFSISTSKLKKSQRDGEILIKKISDENGMSHEYEKWRRKKNRGNVIFVVIIFLILIIWIVYKRNN
jgi:hypothetical protein